MKAIFIGKNESCGFINGQEYDIETHCCFNSNNTGRRNIDRPVLMLYSGKLKCPYSRLETLLGNWKII